MKRVGNKDITANQLTSILVGTMVGIGILSLPSDVVKYAKQDGWMAVPVGAIYPLYLAFIAILLYRKVPGKNILDLGKICLGKFFGTFFNLLLLAFFMFYVVSITSGLCNLLRTAIVIFLSPIKLISIIVFLGVFTASKELKVLGRLNEFALFLTFVLSIIPGMALVKGSSLNIMPIFHENILDILKASRESMFSYGGIEILFFIYPNLTEKGKFKRSVLSSVLIVAVIYTWVVFLTIYYLGIDLTSKFLWPVAGLTKTIEIPIISNFRFIFVTIWTILIFKTVSNVYYGVNCVLDNMLKKINLKYKSYLLFPLAIYLSMQLINETTRREFLSFITPKYTLFVTIYITLITILAYLKGNVVNEA